MICWILFFLQCKKTVIRWLSFHNAQHFEGKINGNWKYFVWVLASCNQLLFPLNKKIAIAVLCCKSSGIYNTEDRKKWFLPLRLVICAPGYQFSFMILIIFFICWRYQIEDSCFCVSIPLTDPLKKEKCVGWYYQSLSLRDKGNCWVILLLNTN